MRQIISLTRLGCHLVQDLCSPVSIVHSRHERRVTHCHFSSARGAFFSGFYFIERSVDKVTGEMIYNWRVVYPSLCFCHDSGGRHCDRHQWYLLGSVFINHTFYGVAIMIPNLAFIAFLYKRDRILLKYKPLLPLYDYISPSLKFEHHDNLAKALVFSIIHALRPLNMPVFACKLLFGMMLYSTKIFAIAGVSNRWI